MKKEEGYELLKEIIDQELTHPDYKRVTYLADHYYKLKTGDGIEKLLHRIETRVSEEEFDQIKRIYRSIVPSVLNSTKMPFQKACRKQPEVREIKYDKQSDQRKIELEQNIGMYWGDKSLEEYLEYAYVDYNYIDPNAFLITEFDEFDPRVEKAKPYPFIASSAEAIMFEYQNEWLKYLVVRLPIKFSDGTLQRDGYKYTMYLGMDTIELSQVASRGDGETVEIKGKFYSVVYYNPKNEYVPAIRFGYIRDEQTKGRTFVSVFHSVIGYLEKSLKIDCELDLATAMTAFPQRFQYVSPCRNQGCRRGVMPDGKNCIVCEGTGHEPFHKGTQDVITLSLPNDPQQMVELEKLLVYKYPPIDGLQFQHEYLEHIKKSVHLMMFNADLYTRSQVSTTATEKLLEADNLNDTLYPFARHYSAIWEFVVWDIAVYTDLVSGLKIQHKFPKDFKFKSLSELMSDLKSAKDAGASTSTIAAIEDDINEILYSDRPDALKQMHIKNDINPFRGYSDANIRYVLGNEDTPRENRILWENLEAIFNELELERPDIYDLAKAEIVRLVNDRVTEYINRIDSQKRSENYSEE